MRICQHHAPSHARNNRLRTWKAIADTGASGIGIAPMLDRLWIVSRYLPSTILAPIRIDRIEMPTLRTRPFDGDHITVPSFFSAFSGGANLALKVS